jgi:post-segregation antitoxin (ccd killing protein)
VDAALTLQQDRIHASADAAFAESMARFRENLGTVEQVLQESSQSIVGRSLEDLESKASNLKHQTVEDLCKSAEWYEKKAQTHLQQISEKVGEQTAAHLHEKAGEVSSLFASELNQTSGNFLEHTQSQLGDAVRDSFERARMLFAEVSDTTAAAFTDEIQRTARTELDGFTSELGTALGETRQEIAAARLDMTRQVTSEQEEFLRRFQTGMSGAVEAGIATAHEKVQAGFGPLLESWKSMTDAHQEKLRETYGKMNDTAVEQYHGRLENVSNSWMLAAAATLDHNSRRVIDNLAKEAEERLRETCSRVFAGIGDSLRERLQQIAVSFAAAEKPSSE